MATIEERESMTPQGKGRVPPPLEGEVRWGGVPNAPNAYGMRTIAAANHAHLFTSFGLLNALPPPPPPKRGGIRSALYGKRHYAFLTDHVRSLAVLFDRFIAKQAFATLGA